MAGRQIYPLVTRLSTEQLLSNATHRKKLFNQLVDTVNAVDNSPKFPTAASSSSCKVASSLRTPVSP